MLLKNESLVIRNATINDADILLFWWNDGKVMAHAGFPLGLKTNKETIIKQINSQNEFSNRMIIELNNKAIGEMSYNIKNEIAEIGIKICDFSEQEKGYGKRLLKMLIKYLFNEKKVKKIILDTNLLNERAQHVYEKIGFVKLRINRDSWKNQLNELQSSVDYEMTYERYANELGELND